MGTTERRERERQALRKKILDAARDLFASEGIDSVTMRRIADRIEYSPTAIYLHFKDKLSLLRALCEHDFEELQNSLSSALAIPGAVERLRAIFRTLAQFAVQRPNHFRFMFLTSTEADAQRDWHAGANPQRDYYAFVKLLVRDAVDSGQVRGDLADSAAIAQTFIAAVHGILALHVVFGQGPGSEWQPVEKRIDFMVDTLLRGLGAGGP